MLLSELALGQTASVVSVEDAHPADTIAQRLRDLGFVSGELIKIRAVGPLGAEPILVNIASSQFALRRNEAARIRITLASSP
ncbi:MAG: FeoA family protein [Arenimonas sp.]